MSSDVDETVDDVVARIHRIEELARALQEVRWSDVPGMKTATVATFAGELEQAADRLRARNVATDGGRNQCGGCGFKPDEWDTHTSTRYGRTIERDRCPRCGTVVDEQSKKLVTDGGVDIVDEGPAVEAGCNCEHLADSATCHWCVIRQPTPGPSLMTDGGQPAAVSGEQAAPSRPSSDSVSSKVLSKRVDELEEQIDKKNQTITDLVAMVNELQSDVRELEGRVDDVVFVDQEAGDDE